MRILISIFFVFMLMYTACLLALLTTPRKQKEKTKNEKRKDVDEKMFSDLLKEYKGFKDKKTNLYESRKKPSKGRRNINE